MIRNSSILRRAAIAFFFTATVKCLTCGTYVYALNTDVMNGVPITKSITSGKPVKTLATTTMNPLPPAPKATTPATASATIAAKAGTAPVSAAAGKTTTATSPSTKLVLPPAPTAAAGKDSTTTASASASAAGKSAIMSTSTTTPTTAKPVMPSVPASAAGKTSTAATPAVRPAMASSPNTAAAKTSTTVLPGSKSTSTQIPANAATKATASSKKNGEAAVPSSPYMQIAKLKPTQSVPADSAAKTSTAKAGTKSSTSASTSTVKSGTAGKTVLSEADKMELKTDIVVMLLGLIDAGNNGGSDDFLKTLYSDQESYEKIHEQIGSLSGRNDLHFTLGKVDIISMNGQLANINAEIEVTAKGDEENPDGKRVVFNQILKRQQNEWKVSNLHIAKIEPIHIIVADSNSNASADGKLIKN